MYKKVLSILVVLLTLSTTVGSNTSNKLWIPFEKKSYTPFTAKPLIDPTQKECLSLNIYFEAAIESTAGKLAVAQVTLNRVKSTRYPNTICKVVKEGSHHASGHPKRDQCQFSWYCDGKGDEPRETPAWRDSQVIAEYVLTHPNLIDITDGATHYHADYIPPPRWARKKEMTLQIDTHKFYNKQNNFNF